MYQLSDQELVERTGLQQVVDRPTRVINVLDRIHVSGKQCSAVHVIASAVRSDHNAVIVYADEGRHISETAAGRDFRRKSPAQNAQFLQLAASAEIECYEPDMSNQTGFDDFYCAAVRMLETSYPERSVAVTCRDPDRVTS
jgi:hypothetical protein